MYDCLPRFRPNSLKIGNVVIDPPLILAPMAGVTDDIYRRIMADHGAGLVTTEMISVEGLRRNQARTWRLCAHDADLMVPLAVQIFGNSPQRAAEAARLVEGNGALLIDLNAGCPVKKVVRQGAGAALLREPDRLAFMVEALKKAVSIPVTVKIRLGWDEESSDPVGLAKRLESAGADAITVHGRTAVQHYAGKADWSWIEKVKTAVSIPVVGNGDIDSPALATHMLQKTRCDAIMIGRGTLGNPWLLSSIAARWSSPAERTGSSTDRTRDPDWGDYCETACAHLKAVEAQRPRSLGYLRKILTWYSKGCPDSSRLRAKLLASTLSHDMQIIFRQWVEEIAARGTVFLPMKVPVDESIESLILDDGDQGR